MITGAPRLAAAANYTGGSIRQASEKQEAAPTLMHDYGDQAAGNARRAAGELEAAALAVLQASGSALTPGEVLDRLGGGLAYTTVVTILSRLHAKGVLTRLRSGRAYSYAPVADEPGLAARRMRGVLDAEADREAVLARFVSELAPADEDLLRRVLADPAASS